MVLVFVFTVIVWYIALDFNFYCLCKLTLLISLIDECSVKIEYPVAVFLNTCTWYMIYIQWFRKRLLDLLMH